MTTAIYLNVYPTGGSPLLMLGVLAFCLFLGFKAFQFEYPTFDWKKHRGSVLFVVGVLVLLMAFPVIIRAQQPYDACAVCKGLEPWTFEWIFWQCFMPWCD